MKLKRMTENEMREAASEMAEKLTIREYDDGSSVDYQRSSSPEEKAVLENVFYAAMLTLSLHGSELTKEKIQMVKDFAEFQGDILMHDIGTPVNGYDTIYNPLGRFVEANLERQKDGREM